MADNNNEPIRWSYLGRPYRLLFSCEDGEGRTTGAVALATERQLEQAGYVRKDLLDQSKRDAARITNEQLEAILSDEAACREASVVQLALDLRDARANAQDVRTLDEWARKNRDQPPLAPRLHYPSEGGWYIQAAPHLVFEGDTPDEARAKAAAWVTETAPQGATCLECLGEGRVAKMPAFGVFVADDGVLATESCRACKGSGRK